MNKVFVADKLFASVEARSLSAALSLACSIVERRNTYPMLGMAKLAIDGSVMTVTGSDLDNEIVTTVDLIDGAGKWSLCVDARLLAGVARSAGVAEMRLDRLERTIPSGRAGQADVTELLARITVGDGISYEIMALETEAYPELKGSTGEIVERFGNGSLAAQLDKVAWCISTEETRYYLNGVAWQYGASGRRFVATDGHKLALCHYASDPAAKAWSRIIPSKPIAVLQRFARGLDVAVSAVVRPNEQTELVEAPGLLEFSFGRTRLRLKLIEVTFPDVDRVIPAADKRRFRFDMPKAELLGAINSVAVLSGRGRFSGRALRFDHADGKLVVGMKSADVGSASYRTSADWPSGAEAPTEFGFNANYLRELVATCSGALVIHGIDAGSPFAIADEDETMTRIIMPMRV